jgi:phospholipid/cholesterol/gamma-HCH transport system substrate-binding protein
MKRNLIETLLGFIVIVVAVYFFFYSTKTGQVSAPSGGYEVTAAFSEIGGLKIGDDVRMSGVKVGTVTKLSLHPETYLAQVTMQIDSAVQLPDDTASRVSSESLLGGTFLALDPGASEEFIPDGGRITFNQDAQNLERLLGQFIFSLQNTSDNTQSASNDTP